MPYNPLDKENLGKSILDAFLKSEALPLGDLETITGAGVYALYYRGKFPLYAPLRTANKSSFDLPIYVGKAVPKGGRKGLAPLDASSGTSLIQRLRQHAKSICSATNIEIGDFWCRYLVVDDIWIPLGESLTIQRYRPLWNQVIEGFGNNAPGAGRHKGARPMWDELHPGRSSTLKCAPAKVSVAEIKKRIDDYFSTS